MEVYQLTGKAISSFWQEGKDSALPYNFINIAISPKKREALHQSIAQRFKKMLAQDLITEVTALHKRDDLSLDMPSMRAVAYRQIYQYLNGEFDYTTMCDKTLAATRQLAKRQLTWLRNWPSEIKWFDSFDSQLHTLLNDYIKLKGNNFV